MASEMTNETRLLTSGPDILIVAASTHIEQLT
jgi:hypothetical protein